MDDTPPLPTARTGGSAAGQALRAELAKKGIDPEADFAAAAAVHVAASTPALAVQPEARTALRKKVNGRAHLTLQGGTTVLTAKMIDLSTTGACVLMEDMLQPKKLCDLHCDIFHAGKRYAFTTQAITVYGVLASGMGFKIGLHFGPHDGQTARTIATLVGS